MACFVVAISNVYCCTMEKNRRMAKCFVTLEVYEEVEKVDAREKRSDKRR